ncbi:M16 family metallopeptidase [Sorangium atrum]|uniref:Pitrilysin family protein n=1 Tax=Sorangium atrum TaxID=2995308 RepID=A0ABT5CGJ9_9BACT|nr:pitrilysin family protein [Sorangium aterium]MDC0685565.1 pitrilysin family protein [Sorangium aterium]
MNAKKEPTLRAPGRARTAGLVAGLLAVATPLAAAADPSGAPGAGPVAGGIEGLVQSAAHFRLSNGLEVLLEEDHRQPTVAVVVAYEIGSRDDPRGYDQLAHLVEHMTYRGSRHMKPLEALSLLERAGVHRMNGVTGPDYTAYYALVPAAALPLALWIESERMAFTLERFDEQALALEQKIVRNELLESDGIDGMFRRHTLRAIFGQDHPYSGAELPLDDLEAIELRHAQWFFQQGYRPSNARLILVGDIDPQATRALVERYFGPVVNPKAPFVRRRTAPPAFAAARRVTFENAVYREQIEVCWAAPPAASRERVAAGLVADALAQSLRARLVDDQGTLSHVDTDIDDLDLGSVFSVSAALTKHATHDGVEAAIEREIHQMWGMDWGAVLPEVKQTAIVRELISHDKPLSRAFRHLQSLRSTSRPFNVARRIAEIGGVTPDDMLRLRRYFTPDRRLVARLVRVEPEDVASPEGKLTVDAR